MGILSNLLGDTGGGLIKGVADAADRFIQTKDEASAIELKKMALNMQSQLQQIDVNKVEAKHSSVFVAGARPATLWICAFALGYHYIIQPFLVFAVHIYDPTIPQPPSIDMSTLTTILLGLLGLGGLRTYEKVKKVNRDSLKEGS